jgi:hypothetical protein
MKATVLDSPIFGGSMSLGSDCEELMFSDAIVTAADDAFGSPQLGMELVVAGILFLAIMLYVARVAWIALADARRMELKAVHSGATQKSTSYSGPVQAG